MDGGSWMLKAAAAGDMHGGGGGDTVIRCSWSDMATTELRHHEQEPAATMMMSSLAMQQQLSQIYMLMDMEEHDQYATTPSPSSSSFRSFSAATTTSRDDNSSLMLAAAAATSTTTVASCHHQTEVSSQILSPPEQAARRSSGHGAAAAATAFRPYSRYLGPKKNLLRRPGATTTTGGGGQRAFKKAISVMSKIHTARLTQYYQIMEMAARPSPTATGGGGGDDGGNNQQLQLQHVLSERKRREKLNDSFKALRDVLPPATKKDKASVLMGAKDYVNVLKARIAELEEKNRKLAESQLHTGDGDGDDDDDRPDDDKIEVNIGRSAAAADGGTRPDKCQELHLKIVLGSSSGCSAMDAVAGILQGLNEKRDGSSSSGRLLLPRAESSQQPAVRLQLKSSSCDEEILKESVIKDVKDVMQSETVRL